MEYVTAPGITLHKVEDRRYQATLAQACLRENTLVILPTGLGKTAVALRVAAAVLQKRQKVLVLAPTKPLVEQHRLYFSECLSQARVGVMNGTVVPAKRAAVLQDSDLIVSTPQAVANDLDKGAYDLGEIGLIVYDEAHRGTGNYAYVDVARYRPLRALALGMTASPGSDLHKIEEVCRNLALTRIDVRADDDPDVAPYVHDTYVNRIEVNMPKDLTDITALLRKLLDHYFLELTELRLTQPNWPPSTRHMLVIGQNLQARLHRGEKTMTVFRGLSVQSICIKLLHAIDLAETQGMSALRTYLGKINEGGASPQGSKADRELCARTDYKQVWQIASTSKVEHPKISRTMSLVSQVLHAGGNPRVIVFTQYRESCDILAERLALVDGARVCKLIGQANGGLKQREQVGIIDDFRRGKYNVIVSTSVGEEGLDITSTNAVIFYEPISSEIRTIQRRGRTGRKNDGEVYVLIAKGTMDEVTENSSRRKEELMRQRLTQLSSDLKKQRSQKPGQSELSEF